MPLIVTFCFPPEGVVENLVLLKGFFPLELRFDFEHSSEVPLGVMFVPAIPEILTLFWHFSLERSSKHAYETKRGGEDVSFEIPPK